MKYAVSLMLFLMAIVVNAQEKLTLTECESIFLKNNLLLLAERYNIDASQAAVIQARIWEQPYFSAEFNALNPQDNKLLDVGSRGQKAFAIQQLVYLGSKKRKEIAFAQANVKIAELQLESLLRNLKYELRQIFFEIYFNQKQVQVIEEQLQRLDTLVSAYREQTDKGNLPMKDLVRLQALYFDLKNERNDLKRLNIELQSNLQLILGINNPIEPQLPENFLDSTALLNIDVLSDSTMLSLAFQNRTDLQLAQQTLKSNQQQLIWQKALSVPDFVLGISYDQRGGAFNNQVNLTFGIPLPIWKRNKGNIAFAKVQLSQSEAYINYIHQQIQNEITLTRNQWREAKQNYTQYKTMRTEDFDFIYRGIVQNFQKGNISLLEFTDFMESYNTSIRQFNEITKNYVLAAEAIIRTIQTNIF